MPNSAHHHPLPKLPKLSRLGRSLAALQVAKETLTIIFLGLPLVKAVPLAILTALPGVVLYLLHWHLVLGHPARRLAVIVWIFTLIDEAWGLLLFGEFDTATRGQVRFMYWSYFVGLAIIVTALLEIGWRWQQQRAKARRNVHHHAMSVGRARQ
jgi:toxin CptA